MNIFSVLDEQGNSFFVLMIFYMNVFYFSFLHWLLHGEQGSLNISSVLNEQGVQAVHSVLHQRRH